MAEEPQDIINRSRGYLALRLYSSPKVVPNKAIFRPPKDAHEQRSLERAHEVSECAIFDTNGDIVMVVKAMADSPVSVRIGVKATDDYLIVLVKKLDDEQKEKLAKFHAQHNGTQHDRSHRIS